MAISLGKFFYSFFPRKIWQQIFAILILLVLVPMLVLGTLLINTSQDTIKKTVLNDYEEIAKRAGSEVQERIKAAQTSLSLAASLLGTLGSSPWRQETVIVELSLKNPNFKRIAYVNANGQELVTSELGTPLLNRSTDKIFQAGVKKKESYMSNVRIADNYVPMITLVEPIEMLGEVKAFLMAELTVRDIWETIDAIRLGQTGRAYLIDEQGRIIAHPDKKVVLQSSEGFLPELTHFYLAGKDSSFESESQNGTKYLNALAAIRKLNWTLVIRQESQEALAFSKTMQLQSWMLIVLSILATLFISLLLARYMSRPLNKIVESTKRMAKGDYENTFRIKRRDEVGRLMFSFNRIKQKLLKARKMERTSIIGEAATSIAHELKNSLVLVNTFIKLLPDRHLDRKFIQEFSNTIPKELESWNSMLRGMMDFSQDKIFNKAPININSVIQDIVALAHLRLKQKNIHLYVRQEDKLPLILGNAEKIKQVVLNVVTNSIDATPIGGTVILETNLLGPEGIKSDISFLEIKVINTGEIISKTNLRKIFNPFFTTKTQGMGLGLAISYDIICQHGGRIDVSSDDAQGTQFSIKIPVFQDKMVEIS